MHSAAGLNTGNLLDCGTMWLEAEIALARDKQETGWYILDYVAGLGRSTTTLTDLVGDRLLVGLLDCWRREA